MILPIYVNGNDVLRQECHSVTPEHEHLDTLIENMYQSMAAADGVGLAAPQVGVAIRLFVVDLTEYDDEDMVNNDTEVFRRTFINPEIVESSENLCPYKEGCLSVPGITEMVERPAEVTMRYFDENWQPQQEHFTGIWARVTQHELDHLDGKLFVDHLSPLRKQLIKSKLLGIHKGNFKARYRTKK
ncbi:MAG: peptide deformylase [Mucinivorans sp.]